MQRAVREVAKEAPKTGVHLKDDRRNMNHEGDGRSKWRQKENQKTINSKYPGKRASAVLSSLLAGTDEGCIGL